MNNNYDIKSQSYDLKRSGYVRDKSKFSDESHKCDERSELCDEKSNLLHKRSKLGSRKSKWCAIYVLNIKGIVKIITLKSHNYKINCRNNETQVNYWISVKIVRLKAKISHYCDLAWESLFVVKVMFSSAFFNWWKTGFHTEYGSDGQCGFFKCDVDTLQVNSAQL